MIVHAATAEEARFGQSIVGADVLRRQRHFRRLMLALARPGQLVDLSAADWTPISETAWALVIADVLLDHEVSFAVLGDGLNDAGLQSFADRVLDRTGARRVPAAEASFAFAFGAVGQELCELPVGDPEFPDQGATLIWSIEAVGRGPSIVLRGPGVDGRVDIAVDGPSPREWDMFQTINRAYPRGLDAFFVDRYGRCIGVPRSTQIELPAGDGGSD